MWMNPKVKQLSLLFLISTIFLLPSIHSYALDISHLNKSICPQPHIETNSEDAHQARRGAAGNYRNRNFWSKVRDRLKMKKFRTKWGQKREEMKERARDLGDSYYYKRSQKKDQRRYTWFDRSIDTFYKKIGLRRCGKAKVDWLFVGVDNAFLQLAYVIDNGGFSGMGDYYAKHTHSALRDSIATGFSAAFMSYIANCNYSIGQKLMLFMAFSAGTDVIAQTISNFVVFGKDLGEFDYSPSWMIYNAVLRAAYGTFIFKAGFDFGTKYFKAELDTYVPLMKKPFFQSMNQFENWFYNGLVKYRFLNYHSGAKLATDSTGRILYGMEGAFYGALKKVGLLSYNPGAKLFYTPKLLDLRLVKAEWSVAVQSFMAAFYNYNKAWRLTLHTLISGTEVFMSTTVLAYFRIVWMEYWDENIAPVFQSDPEFSLNGIPLSEEEQIEKAYAEEIPDFKDLSEKLNALDIE